MNLVEVRAGLDNVITIHDHYSELKVTLLLGDNLEVNVSLDDVRCSRSDDSWIISLEMVKLFKSIKKLT